MKYRPDIDGLRAVAVLSVLLFHLGVPGIHGGFVGVDVFFVISGVLITTILARDLDLGRFSLAHFYRRRALRILPPLLVVIAATILASAFVLLPSELRSLGGATVASALFASNIYFWSTVSYFTPSAKDNPLLHTWSLGVEEQFYILVPLLLWLVFRLARRWVVPLFALTVAISFGLALVAVRPQPETAFYLLPFRYWELGFGALLALTAGAGRLRGWLAHLVSVAGIGLILYGVLALTPYSVFPGLNALWPVLGATALIAAGENGIVGRLLATPAPVWIGKISYSLYLWHWPIIVLWKMRFGPDLSGTEMAGLGLAAVALAALSTRFVERPFRSIPDLVSDARVLLGAGAMLVVATCGGLLLMARPVLLPLPDGVRALDRYADYREDPEFIAGSRRGVCFLNSGTAEGFAAYDRETCLGSDGSRPELVLMGDSLAAHLWGALAGARPDLAVLQATASGCRPLLGNGTGTYCGRMSQFMYKSWLPDHRPAGVVLSGRWSAGDLKKLDRSIRYLHGIGIEKITVLGPTLEYREDLPKLLARDLRFGTHRTPGMVVDERWRLGEAMRQVVTAAGGQYVDLLGLLCPERPCRAQIAEGVPMQFDYGHYTVPAARFVANAIGARL